MKVKLARKAGFCMGVRRAMELVLSEANKRKEQIFTYGPLIHNQQVLSLLESKGVKTVTDLTSSKKGTIVIRAHGIPPSQRQILRSSGLKIIDATCPRVARVQSIIRYHTKKGHRAIIVGDMDHPEVIGLIGYAEGQAEVINCPEDVSRLPDHEKMFIVAQTTQNEETYRQVVNAVKDRFPGALVFDTICDATQNRQAEVRSFANQVDGVVVVGGYHSGNTRRLVQVSEAIGLPTFHIETEKELDRDKFSSMEVIGVTAGASTPNWMIQNVVKEIEAIQSRKETIFGRKIKRLFKVLLLSNVIVAMGAFSLSYAASFLLGRRPNIIHPSIAFLYIYAMYVLNRFLDKGASAYNDPERANFYKKHRIWLIFTGLTAILGALVLSFSLGSAIFLTMAGLSLLGIFYSVSFVPTRLQHLWKYSKIKDIPGSRTLSEALAWGVVIALLPLLEVSRADSTPAIVTFLFVFSMVYTRSGLFDIFQLQGDLIVGVETLPIILGKRSTLLLLKSIIIAAGLILLLSPALGLVGSFSYLLIFCFLSLFFCLQVFEKNWLYPGTRLEILVEGNFYLAGIIGLLWHLVG